MRQRFIVGDGPLRITEGAVTRNATSKTRAKNARFDARERHLVADENRRDLRRFLAGSWSHKSKSRCFLGRVFRGCTPLGGSDFADPPSLYAAICRLEVPMMRVAERPSKMIEPA